MLTAKEARLQSEKNITDEINNQLIEIENIIVGAILNGNYKVFYYQHLNDKTRERLISLGYGISQMYDQRDSSATITISWK